MNNTIGISETSIGQRASLEYVNHIDGGHPESNFRWEPFTATYINLLPKAKTVVDCGAEFGYYSYLAVKHAKPDCRIIAFEPEEVRYELIKEFFSRYPKVEVYPFGVSDKSGTSVLSKPGPGKSATMDLNLSQYAGTDTKGETFSMTTVALDEFLGSTDIDIIKMDIEGAEALALAGMQAILAKQKTVIFIEIHYQYMVSIRKDGWQLFQKYIKDADYVPVDHNFKPAELKGRVLLVPRIMAKS